jgi:hypothetical protein
VFVEQRDCHRLCAALMPQAPPKPVQTLDEHAEVLLHCGRSILSRSPK